jgi:anti-sigma factor RsiW
MNHPVDEILLSFADGELDDAAGSGVERHVAACDGCTATLAAFRELDGALALAVRAIDAAEPEAWQHARFEPGAGRPATGVTAARRRAGSRSAPPAWRWAAGIVLAAAAAGSAAVIAFPELVRPGGGEAVAPAPAAVETRAAAAAPAGVHVAAVQGRVDVVLAGVAAGTRLRVELVAGNDAGVHVAGVGTARFLAGDGRIEADLRGEPAAVMVSVPRGVRIAEITANGVVAVRVTDGHVTPSEAAAEGVILQW